MSTFILNTIKNKECIKKSEDEYIKMFWVGLMDGDGSIQVNHWKYKSLQYRLVIKLSNITSIKKIEKIFFRSARASGRPPTNYNMLIKIAKVIGGNVRITGKNKEVIWVVNNKKTIQEIIKIFDSYPPLTSKKICQLEFLKRCLLENSVESYLLNRNSKYNNQSTIINSFCQPADKYKNYFPFPNYFKEWLSGFVEAEGCFSIRKNNIHYFSIGQKDDYYLINAIKQYLGASNAVRNTYSNFYFLEIYKKETLKNIINNFNNYPLLGEKAESFQIFNQKFKL
jgi:LAGLIDADG endonuclease